MAITRRTATALLLAGLATPVFAKAMAAKTTAVKVPTRGFALPDWLAAEPRVPADAVLDALRARGFETIRLPVDPALVTTDFAVNVAEALAMVTGKGFNALLDLHPSGDVDADQVDAAWGILAGVIATTSPDQVYAELLNEPPLDPKQWAQLAFRLIATIRAQAPDHKLIWGPARVQGIWELADQTPPADPNVIASVHYYTPMGFTHQGENWDQSPLARLKNLPFPTTRQSPEVAALAATLDAADLAFLNGEFAGPWTVEHIRNDFADLSKWAKRHKLAVMLGEFGVLNFAVDPISRANWIRAVREAAEGVGAGWVYWEADQGFGFIADRQSTNGFDDTMIGALLA